jgi:tetraacyldisaccharide 4'-kinase
MRTGVLAKIDDPGSNRRLEAYLLSVMHGRPGPAASLLRAGLSALAWIYCAGLETYLLLYRLGLRRRTRLSCPVICVGNLTTGGTGKTPMTQRLCRLLRAQGKRVVILSRGYGGVHEYGSALVSDGSRVLLTAAEAGDEAYLLAKTLHDVPVLVGKDRRVTGRVACEQFQPEVIVLDDGLQFWQLHRDLDIVLLNASAPFDNGWTLPRGLLREPPSHLRRAGMIVLTGSRQAGAEQTQRVRAQVSRLAPRAPLSTANLMPTGLVIVNAQESCALDWLQGRRVAALSALGHPASFEATLDDLGGILVARFPFRDHRALSTTDLERVMAEAVAAGAEAVITTEKDAVKIAPCQTPLPLLALQVEMQIDSDVDFLQTINAHIDPS